MLPAEIIKKKRNGQSLSNEEIQFFIRSYTDGSLPDYQMSALLMAIYFSGMNEAETLSLTKAMLNSGVVVDFSNLALHKVDKHSTGGVGDKTSLILGPIVAAAGVAVPMISGRGLGHTGGTLDKLESIPGFNTQISIDDFKSMIAKHGISFIGQTKEICPADKKIYALRDVTATVESLPLICASIMSKKLAEGIDSLVLDVKFGNGAFMKTAEKAEELARALMSIAQGYGKKVSALITNMNQPLGRFAGNALEVEECLSIMKNEGHPMDQDTRELSLKLSAEMLYLAGKAKTKADGYKLATEILESGKALAKFEELCKIQGGDLSRLPKPKHQVLIKSTEDGFVSTMETEKIGVIGIQIRAGRAQTTDLIEPTAGIQFHKKVGDKVSAGETLFTLFGADEVLLKAAAPHLEKTMTLSKSSPSKPQLVWKEL
ncbi:MAG: thymidine phosphorylase [Oligoflexia bacterium]|nr:MAG: thymidine phosphorylase [Oligoflexia bacterium]